MKFRLTVIAILLSSLVAGRLYAIGSEEKTPEEKAEDSAKKSVSLYNDAVKKIDKAKKMGEKGDTTYSYNYRITTDERMRKEYEKAVEKLQESLELNPKFKEAHNNLGYCYRKLGKLNESLAAYDKAIALDSNFAQAREYRGETYLALNRIEDAEHEMEFLKEIKSDYAVQLAMAIEMYKLDNKEKASSSTGE